MKFFYKFSENIEQIVILTLLNEPNVEGTNISSEKEY